MEEFNTTNLQEDLRRDADLRANPRLEIYNNFTTQPDIYWPMFSQYISVVEGIPIPYDSNRQLTDIAWNVLICLCRAKGSTIRIHYQGKELGVTLVPLTRRTYTVTHVVREQRSTRFLEVEDRESLLIRRMLRKLCNDRGRNDEKPAPLFTNMLLVVEDERNSFITYVDPSFCRFLSADEQELIKAYAYNALIAKSIIRLDELFFSDSPYVAILREDVFEFPQNRPFFAVSPESVSIVVQRYMNREWTSLDFRDQVDGLYKKLQSVQKIGLLGNKVII